MRRLKLILLLAIPLAVTDGQAQSGAMDVLCEPCRDPLEHPEDWANFAFNQVYGEDGWMDFDQADDFFIYNLDGDRVYVDVDFVMGGINLFGNTLPLWPENMLMITLALPNGTVVHYLRSVFLHPLPVPSPPGPESDSDGNDATAGGGGESGDDGVDDESLDEETEWPEIERDGTVRIVDPDEDGEFPDADWCEEC